MRACAGIKARVQTNFSRAACVPKGTAPSFPSVAAAASFALLNTYADVAHTCVPYPTEAHVLAPEEDSAAVHLAQHLITKMDVVKGNNDRIAAGELQASDATDQGFVRPIALVLAPTRGVAYGCITRLLQLIQRGIKSAPLHMLLDGRSACWITLHNVSLWLISLSAQSAPQWQQICM